MIKKNMKLVIGIILGIISVGGVYAASSLSAESIKISKDNMSKIPQENLQSALDYLYDKANTTNMITIESGVKHETQTYLGVAYLDPANLENKCTSANSVSTTGTKTGCMKWYIYKDLGNSYKMILDHNTTAVIAWNDDEKNVAYEESKVYSAIQELTSTEEGGLGWDVRLNPDIITAKEVSDIVGYSNFNSVTSNWFYLDSKNQRTYPNYQGGSNYSWLFDNLGLEDDYGYCIQYGCNITDTTSSVGYWTKDSYGEVGLGYIVWVVDRFGALDFSYGTKYNQSEGIRPVITVLKSQFSNLE